MTHTQWLLNSHNESHLTVFVICFKPLWTLQPGMNWELLTPQLLRISLLGITIVLKVILFPFHKKSLPLKFFTDLSCYFEHTFEKVTLQQGKPEYPCPWILEAGREKKSEFLPSYMVCPCPIPHLIIFFLIIFIYLTCFSKSPLYEGLIITFTMKT